MYAAADAMAKGVMSLHVPGTGVWASLHRDGSRVEMRHCYDFATVGCFMASDLPANVRGEMVDFVKRELLTQRWMRAQSKLDVAAATSDRPDHGSMGAYDAWPAVTVDAMCALGYWDDAIPFLRRTQAAIYEGVYAQAREFYGLTRGQYDAPGAHCPKVRLYARVYGRRRLRRNNYLCAVWLYCHARRETHIDGCWGATWIPRRAASCAVRK